MGEQKETTDLRFRESDTPSARYRGIARVQRGRDWLWRKLHEARARGDKRAAEAVRQRMRECRMNPDA